MKLIKISEKNDPVMRAVKAVHSISTAGDSVAPEDLKRQRDGQDVFSKLATPIIEVTGEVIDISGMPAEWARPTFAHSKETIILYCHGGGYTCGSLNYARVLGTKLALNTGFETLFFEYRLAPENPYPAAIEDAVLAWDYLMKYGYGAKNVIVAGDSAGGNLALELCLKLKEQGRMMPKALILFSPWTDMTVTNETYKTHLEMDPMLTPEYVKAVRGAYAGGNVDFSRPEFSPVFADLSGFPKTLIQVGSHEILLGDSTLLAEKLKEYEIPVKLEIFENGWHVFQQMPLKRARMAMKAVGEFTQNL